jgi:hypothetical protein
MEGPYLLSLTLSQDDSTSSLQMKEDLLCVSIPPSPPVSIPPSPHISVSIPPTQQEQARIGTVHLNNNPHVFGTTVLIKNTHFNYRLSFIYPKYTYYIERFGFHYYKLARFPEFIGSGIPHDLVDLPNICDLFLQNRDQFAKDATDYYYFLIAQREKPMDETFLFYLLWTRPTKPQDIPLFLDLTVLDRWLDEFNENQGRRV